MKLHQFGALAVTAIVSTQSLYANPIPQPSDVDPSSDNVIATTEHFHLTCYRDRHDFCSGSSLPEPAQKSLTEIMEQMDASRDWLEDLGFPVSDERLPSVSDGRKELRLSMTGAYSNNPCDDGIACFIETNTSSAGLISRCHIPFGKREVTPTIETFVHEYVHTLQPTLINLTGSSDSGPPTENKWIREMTAEAIGLKRKRMLGGGIEIYSPVHSLDLDLPFWAGDSPGYSKWDYAIYVGNKMGSQDDIAYLSQSGFLGADGKVSHPGDYMDLFYDPALVKNATFDVIFPRYVAQFNSIAEWGETEGSLYYFYSDIQKNKISVPESLKLEAEFDSAVQPFAAAPFYFELDVRVQDEMRPNIFLATLELEKHTTDVQIVREHRFAQEETKDYFLVDGNNPPSDFGFYRVAYTPAPSARDEKEISLRIKTNAVSFEMPRCLRVGEATEIKIEGMEEPADNWEIITDNGRVEGNMVTPARLGDIETEIKITSQITRNPSALSPKQPLTTTVSLGTSKVVQDDCMIRMTAGPSIMTYVFDGEFTEATSPNEPAAYFSRTDMAFYDGQWRELPVFVRQMMVQNIQKNMATGRIRNQGQLVEPGDDMMAQTPYVFSKFFSWDRMRELSAPSGIEAKRSATACPDTGNSGCFASEFVFEGNRIPITYNTNGQPVRVTMSGQTMKFEYGYWDVRRPPGW